MHINLLTLSIIPQFLRFGEGKSVKNPNVAQHTLYDIRDNKPYTVRKLADGNCWMTEDLALSLSSGTTVEAALNTSATPVSFTPTGSGGTSNAATPMNGNTRYDSSTGQWYYNWYAATAGTGASSQANTDASASICPVGWRLPSNYTVSTTKSYGALSNAYGITVNGENNSVNNIAKLESSPLNFARFGHYYNGSLYVNGTNGGHWSSTATSDSARAYGFSYDTVTYAQSDLTRSAGFIVRCVAL